MLPPGEERLIAALWPELSAAERHLLLKLAVHAEMVRRTRILLAIFWPLRVEYPWFDWPPPEARS